MDDINDMNDNKELAIKISNVKKRYKLGQIGGGTLQADLQSWWAKVRGRENPNCPIGQDKRLVGESFMALDGINLTVYRGEALGIIGANGAGKSTLLKLLSRVTAPTEGEMDIYGRISSMLEVGTGFNGQMTGRENVYMNGAILGMTRAEIDEKMDSIIEFSEVADFIDTPVKRYSSGMFVKLAFSVSAHLDSEIMIMDEVLAVGDMAFQRKCLTKMREAASQEGRTVLYVSHNMNTIRELCDRCVVMDNGKIIYDGDVETAIRIYMDKSIEEHAVDMDLTKKSHYGNGIDTGLHMEHLTLVDKVVPVYDGEEPLRLRLGVRITHTLRNVQLRLTLRTGTDEAIGTAWSEPKDFECGLGGEITEEVNYSLAFDMLEKGCFYASIGFYRMNDMGRMVQLDHITRAFQVEVAPRERKVFWQAKAYGYVKFPSIRIE